MNYTMGRAIRDMTDGQRDNLVEGEFNDGGHWWSYADECGCLMGTATGKSNDMHDRVRDRLPVEFWRHIDCLTDYSDGAASLDERMYTVPWIQASASIRYPKAVRRFGKDRVVRAVKLRAAAMMSSEVEEKKLALAIFG